MSRKLYGQSADSNNNRNINGVDWGISDEYDVYSYRN